MASSSAPVAWPWKNCSVSCWFWSIILGSWNSEGHWNRNAKLSMIVVPFSSRLLGKFIIKWSFSLRWRWLMRSSIWESLCNSSSFWSLLYRFLFHMVWLWNFVHKCKYFGKVEWCSKEVHDENYEFTKRCKTFLLFVNCKFLFAFTFHMILIFVNY